MFGGLFSGMFGLGAQIHTNNTNLKIAREANAYNYRMWQENNQYNLPTNVMRRYADAGLNPNLIYSQGAQGAISSAPASNMVTPEFQSPLSALAQMGSLVDFAAGLANLSKSLAEIKNIKSLTDLNDAKKFTEWKRSILLGNQSDQVSQRVRFLDKMNLLDLEAQRIGNRRSQYALMNLDPATYAKTMSDLSYTRAKLGEQYWRNSRFAMGQNPDDNLLFRAVNGLLRGALDLVPNFMKDPKIKDTYNSYNNYIQNYIQ